LREQEQSVWVVFVTLAKFRDEAISIRTIFVAVKHREHVNANGGIVPLQRKTDEYVARLVSFPRFLQIKRVKQRSFFQLRGLAIKFAKIFQRAFPCAKVDVPKSPLARASQKKNDRMVRRRHRHQKVRFCIPRKRRQRRGEIFQTMQNRHRRS